MFFCFLFIVFIFLSILGYFLHKNHLTLLIISVIILLAILSPVLILILLNIISFLPYFLIYLFIYLLIHYFFPHPLGILYITLFLIFFIFIIFLILCFNVEDFKLSERETQLVVAVAVTAFFKYKNFQPEMDQHANVFAYKIIYGSEFLRRFSACDTIRSNIKHNPIAYMKFINTQLDLTIQRFSLEPKQAQSFKKFAWHEFAKNAAKCPEPFPQLSDFKLHPRATFIHLFVSGAVKHSLSHFLLKTIEEDDSKNNKKH